MTAVQDAVRLLRQLPEIQNAYAWRIPSDKQSATNTTDALVTDVLNTSIHGSDQTEDTFETIAVNIFLGKGSNLSLDQLTKSVVSKFEQAGWTTNQISPTTIDPDTNQFTKIFQFTERTTN
ncbi:DUF806 family protein [Xylocopilactobacillus apis]|uniref:DUF806 domain-containing protein n=1 Tax=Xylocopilactobacillus apis TaxID=2932183 RepID=A0AAU9CSC3_9LACO|nr:DUF806 family protein [Xylocopilactobacillus apis]BDR56879.1 hypothetical protein KIMC2_14410 [Xylocopilactobacillus apis]